MSATKKMYFYRREKESLKAMLLMAISSYGIYSLPAQGEQQRFLKTDSLKTQNTVDIVVAMANAGQITELANFLTDRLNNTKPALEDEVQEVGIAKKRPFSMLETPGFFNRQSTYSHVFNHDKKEDEDQDNHVNDETSYKR